MGCLFAWIVRTASIGPRWIVLLAIHPITTVVLIPVLARTSPIKAHALTQREREINEDRRGPHCLSEQSKTSEKSKINEQRGVHCPDVIRDDLDVRYVVTRFSGCSSSMNEVNCRWETLKGCAGIYWMKWNVVGVSLWKRISVNVLQKTKLIVRVSLCFQIIDERHGLQISNGD